MTIPAAFSASDLHHGLPAPDVLTLIHNMVETIVGCDPEQAASVFHPDATITGQQDGVLIRCNVFDYLKFCGRLRIPKRNIHERYRILFHDQTGPAAVVKTAENYPGGSLSAYITASKYNGRWLINNRTIFG